ncbi:MAG: ATP-binding cassette domain-containing protein, partial [candidate division Zixibacteria bacterium]|nr:ATP-binding cassette domain-containing protein [candidate division Zixibacteria bacterium]
MLLVDIQNIVVSYGADTVLDGVSLRVDEGDRIGLIGRNGEGKTTLLQSIIGSHKPDSGSVVMPNYIKFAYLQQDQVHTQRLPLFEDMKSVFEETLRKRHRIKELEGLMASDTENSQYLREYGQLVDEYEAAEGDQVERKIEEVLKGLGFYEHEFTKPVKELSGGQRNRAALARVLLTGADLLLLDEPTNHLDLNGIEFLENYLTSFRGGAIIISHDRTFLDNVANSICEAQRQELLVYPNVNYSGYLPLKRKQHELQLKKFERQQAEIERQEEFIRRNIVGQKTKQAQSRRRMLAKMERMERPAEDTSGMKPVITDIARSGLKVAGVSDVYKSYGDNHVLNGVSIELERGEAAGIIGPNACGKSTLLKIISGLIEADSGNVKIGSNVSIGYFGQHRDDIEYSRTILDQIWDLVPDWEEVK